MCVFHKQSPTHSTLPVDKEGRRVVVGCEFRFPRTRTRLIGWNRMLRPYATLRPSPWHDL